MNNKRIVFLALIMGTILTTKMYANDDVLMDMEDSLSSSAEIQMDDINLDGKLTASERIRKQREKLEERNKNMVEKKIEDIRIKQEMALTNKLSDAFSENKKEEKVAEKKVEVAPVVVAPAPVPTPMISKSLNLQVTPVIGVTSLKGEGIDWESKTSIGISLESSNYYHLLFGANLHYQSTESIDSLNRFSSPVYYNYNYQQAFGSGRKMNLDRVSLGASGKYIFTEESKFRPYVGAGINYNRSTIKYADGGQGMMIAGQTLGSEGLTTSNFSGVAMLGLDFLFSESVGCNLEFSFMKSLNSGMDTQASASYVNPDQQRLQNVMSAVEKGSSTEIHTGIVIKF